jgi:hypothetical protein
MTVTTSEGGYNLLIDGTTSEVLNELVSQGNPKILGYFVDVATDKRYILASRR